MGKIFQVEDHQRVKNVYLILSSHWHIRSCHFLVGDLVESINKPYINKMCRMLQNMKQGIGIIQKPF